MRGTLGEGPGDVGIRNIPLTGGLDGVECWMIEARTQENEAVAVYWARYHGIPIIAHTPDFLTGCGIVGHDSISAGTDDLLAAIGLDQQGGTEGELLLRVYVALPSPDDLSGMAVEGNDERIARPVTAEE